MDEAGMSRSHPGRAHMLGIGARIELKTAGKP